MSELTMSAAEATQVYADERESYEFAFHILPTVAEGEVSGVFDDIKGHITKLGAEILGEEAPERVDLAYEIVKSIEAKNRKFKSAYFGWVRFRLEAEKVEVLMEEMKTHPALLRHLLIKLTKLEEARPFRYHENRKTVKMVEVVDEEKLGQLRETPTEAEEAIEVSDVELDESLEKITGDKEVTEEELK